jgi:hypothetical protein
MKGSFFQRLIAFGFSSTLSLPQWKEKSNTYRTTTYNTGANKNLDKRPSIRYYDWLLNENAPLLMEQRLPQEAQTDHERDNLIHSRPSSIETMQPTLITMRYPTQLTITN